MTDRVIPRVALALLLDQHDDLRAQIAACDHLADALDDGAPVAGALAAAIRALRTAFDLHNRDEERVLRPVLMAAGAEGPLELERRIEEHVREHRAMYAAIDAARVGGLRAVLRELQRHLAEEERYLATVLAARHEGAAVAAG